MTATVLEDLTEDEAYLYSIISDPSGLDLAEFAWYEPDISISPDGCWRAWPFQWKWFRDSAPLQIDQCGRAVGKTTSITLRMFAFPFLYPGQEAVITAPEMVHLEPLTQLIERRFDDSRLGRFMVPPGRSSVTHRPFMMRFVNGARIMGRIPQRDGKGVKGCAHVDTPVWTSEGYKRAGDIQLGDLVLTHEGRYQPVTGVYHDVNDCYEVRGAGSFPMVVSCDHRFMGAENLANRRSKRKFAPLDFHEVESLTESQVYWATPTTFPALPVPPLRFAGSATPIDQRDPHFWWLVGRYLADGCLVTNGNTALARTVWTVSARKVDAFMLVVEQLGLHVKVKPRAVSDACDLTLNSRAFAEWLAEHFGRHADRKRLSAFVLGLPRDQRRYLLEGYLAGDGWFDQKKKRWEVGTASKDLAMGVQLLAQTLGYTVGCTFVRPKVTAITGIELKAGPKVSWRLLIGHGHSVELDNYLVGKVKNVSSVGCQPIVDIRVMGDHSYLTGTIMSHNIHPVWLELDEAQDYPEAGWMELIETLKRGHEGATWRAHGVTRGIRDKFYELTQPSPDNKWRIHRYTGMHRPDWTDEERQQKIQEYKSRESPDYRRNVLGLHGDATNPLFVLRRLMQCVDEDLSSDFNLAEYAHIRVTDEMLNDRGVVKDILEELSLPERHKGYGVTWAGMDVGMTNHPSEILVFAEDVKSKANGKARLKLLTRIHLERISSPNQVRVVHAVMQFYKPKAFAMDKTGLGLPLFQDLQEMYPADAAAIKGYNFSEKILVDFDENLLEQLGEDAPLEDQIKEAGVYKQVLEYSTDKLRELVDGQRVLLPWDTLLIGEFQGQTWSWSKEAMDMYGRRRRVYSQGSFHALDAARMAALGFFQHELETMLDAYKNRKEAPVYDSFVSF